MTDLKNFAAFDEVGKEFFKIPQPHDRWDHWLAGESPLVEVDLVATCVVQYGGRHGRTATHWISSMTSGLAKPDTEIAALAGNLSPNSFARSSVILVV